MTVETLRRPTRIRVLPLSNICIQYQHVRTIVQPSRSHNAIYLTRGGFKCTWILSNCYGRLGPPRIAARSNRAEFTCMSPNSKFSSSPGSELLGNLGFESNSLMWFEWKRQATDSKVSLNYHVGKGVGTHVSPSVRPCRRLRHQQYTPIPIMISNIVATTSI